MKTAQPTILVIVGVTGDLSKRKLLPALEQIAGAGALPDQFRILGITRRAATVDEVLESQDLPYVREHLEMYQMDLADGVEYEGLKRHLDTIETSFGEKTQRVVYLSVPPQFSRPIVKQLGHYGFGNDASTKLLLEKPFGTDLASAHELVAETRLHFTEAQLYRIDHYLAKEMAQNLIVFRNDNALFKQTWNSEFIERIEIVASERIAIEGRADFYEQTGALRDLVQSHLLQLAALVLMDIPATVALEDVPAYRLNALRQLHVRLATDGTLEAVRRQYDGYQRDVGNERSMTETFVDLILASSDPRWRNVPIHVVTGKALQEKATYIRIVYKRADREANELRISLQPNEGIELQLWTKVPGYDHTLEKHSLGITFKDQFPLLPEAYEQVLLDAMRGVHTLFASSEEVLETWRIIDPIQRAWSMQDDDLTVYKKGSAVDDLASR